MSVSGSRAGVSGGELAPLNATEWVVFAYEKDQKGKDPYIFGAKTLEIQSKLN